MSSKVDDRIVNMKINNSQFEKGVADTSKSLQKLKDGLSFKDSGKGLDDISTKAKNFSLQGIADGVKSIADKFGALSIIGITALTNITNKAIDAGLQLVKSLTIDPIKAGFDEYELKMGSIQTILANTSRYGTKLPEVTKNLDELNTYADKTIYNFGDMTKNIGLFTNAGIKIGDATSMIKGFSNEAAASGTNAQGAASAAYQLSQALSAGTIRLMDWRSLQNVGMGNKNMQNGLIEIADAMGTIDKAGISATTVQKDFNGSLEKGWLSADVMSTYLKIMAGDYSNTQMKALGLSDAQIKAFKAQAQMGQDAATKVRTWTQLVGTLQESVGSGWSETFDILLGDFNQATDLFTNVNNAIGPIIDSMSKARNDLLRAWAAGGGRDSLLNSVANVWKAAVALLKPIGEAFREIFPPMTAKTLIDITKHIEAFTKSLIPSQKTIDNIKSTAKGFFAVLDIGRMIIVAVVGLFGKLFGAVAPASGGILEMTGNIGDWLVAVRDAIKNGDGLAKVFNFLGDMGVKVIDTVKNITKWLQDHLAIDGWADAWNGVGKAIEAVWNWLQPFFQWVAGAFEQVKGAVTQAFKSMDFNVLVGLLNVGVLGGIFVIVKKFFDKLPGMFSGIGGGFIDTIKGVFSTLTETMEAMQAKLKAEALIKIAIALGILTAAVVALSLIPTDKLFIALGAMTVMFGQMAAMMKVMDVVMKSPGIVKMPVLAATMIGLATAMVIFAAAVSIMANLSWDELARGLVGMAGGLGILVGATQLLGKNKGQMIASATGVLVLSGAVMVLATAMRIVGSLSWDEIIRSLVALGGALTIVTAAAKIVQSSTQGAAAMFIVSAALTVLGSALLIMAKMNWDQIVRALATLGGSLLIMSIGVAAMQGSLTGAAAMLIVSVAITVLAGAFKIFATMSWDDIGRSLVVLAGGLVIIAAAMALMGVPIVLLGSVGILAAAAAMMVLAPALALLGTMSWDAIGRGLTLLGGALAIIAVGGVLLIPAIPALLALGAAAALIGLGALAAGAGMVMMAAGLGALAAAAAVGSEAIKMALLTLIGLIPAAMTALAKGIIDFAITIAKGGTAFTAAMTTLLNSLITAIGTVGPKIINTLANLLLQLFNKLVSMVPKFVDGGLRLITGILNGIANNVGKMATAATKVITAFMNALATNIPKLADSAAKMVIKLVNGISDSIDRNAAAMGRAGGRLASAIIRGMVNGIGAGIGEIINAAQNMAANALNAAKNFLGIHSPSRKFFEIGGFSTSGMANGLIKTASVVAKAGTHVGQTALDATKKVLARISMESSINDAMTPTIRPVLDLSSIKKDAGQINGLMTPDTLKLDKSIQYANAAQLASNKAQKDQFEANKANALQARASVVFNQINNSPKALTSAEIYRRTNNQLSQAKKELTTVDAQ